MHHRTERDGRRDVVGRHQVVAQQGRRGPVDGVHGAGDRGQEEQDGHAQQVQPDQGGRGEGDQPEHRLADGRGDLAGPPVDGGPADDPEQQTGPRLDGQREARRGGGTRHLEDQQVLHGELHPGARVGHQVGQGPPAHARRAQTAPGTAAALPAGHGGADGRRDGHTGGRHSAAHFDGGRGQTPGGRRGSGKRSLGCREAASSRSGLPFRRRTSSQTAVSAAKRTVVRAGPVRVAEGPTPPCAGGVGGAVSLLTRTGPAPGMTRTPPGSRTVTAAPHRGGGGRRRPALAVRARRPSSPYARTYHSERLRAGSP